MNNIIKNLMKSLQKILMGFSTSRRGGRAENKTVPSGDDAEANDPYTKPFWEHLEDLRVTILWCAFFLFVGIIIAFPLAPTIMTILKLPLVRIGINPDEFLKIIKVTAGFGLATRVIFWSGLLFSLPFMVLAIGSFIFPGLKPKERRAVIYGGCFAVVMFVFGVLMGYFLSLPLGIKFLFQVNKMIGVECSWVEWGDYISFVLQLLIGFGLGFEVPVLIYILGMLGIINSDQLRSKRSIAVVVIMIFAAIMTPPDVFSMIAMSLPLLLLYEFCIWAIRIKEKRKTAVDGGQTTDKG